ncbi:DUF302 domain-containing protein [Asticcacaulis sp. EMRT-3]|uniref:DUF302 domain-containing protein n=1 Tax=Asticcacaulis sp. EMRT-3 TaxID=3040349 RepID=UPI0024AFA907|nr:DUF302 domain-containing protein [Asticcacaulis sp. EMRT-3]MDI7776129.1 DUF302 domain-containing protein [Asticcacaulis sp. EMRT-3]
MKYIVESSKSVDQAVAALHEAVPAHGFGILHIHNLKETMAKKGVAFDHECQILDVCNPGKARAVLSEDMTMSLVLPCKLSVYEEGGKTHIGMVRPTALLGAMSDSPGMAEVAKEVEATLTAIIDAAK